MRVLRSMPRWLPAGIFALALLAAMALPAAAADTATYKLSNYVVTLEPQSSGQVRITYQQEWQVLSGHIAWITVGLANSNYTVDSYSQAASSVSSADSGGFTGVRVDLDKDYQPGESFEVQFVVLQSNLLERLTTEKKWRIDFTPGWYDNAVTDHLQIDLLSPVDAEAYSLLEPQPAISGNTFTWEKSNVPGGGRFEIKVECLDGSFLASTVPVESQGPNVLAIAGLVVGIMFLFAFLVVRAVRHIRQVQDTALKARIAATEKELAADKEKEKAAEKGFKEYVEGKAIKPDEQGRYYDKTYGDYVTPAVWVAVLSNQGQQAQNASRSPSHSCACVSCACACACACAGGGAAGCSKKSLHECQRCRLSVSQMVRTPPGDGAMKVPLPAASGTESTILTVESRGPVQARIGNEK